MSISRRKFLEAAPAAIGAALLIKESALGQKIVSGRLPRINSASTDALSRLTWDSFYPFVNSGFVFHDNSGNAVTLMLTGMQDSKPADFKPTSASQECFCLTFTGPSKPRLEQGTYTAEHFSLGNFSLFITVLGSTKRNCVYSAVINRIVR